MDEFSRNILCRILDILDGFDKKIQKEYSNVEANLTPIARTGETPQLIATENRNRTELWIHNASDVDLFLGPTDDIDSTRYSLPIAANDTLIMNAHNYAQLYKREIYGFWDTNPQSGTKAMVTEYYQSMV